MPNGSKTRGGAEAVAFEAFMDGWLIRQEHYLDELLSVEQHCHESREDDLKDLINRVLSHYQEYYEEKSRVARENIFLVFSPTWFTPFERSFLWIAGFKPALTFRVLNDSVNDLTEDQRQSMVRLIEDTRVSERMLGDELARIHESVASPPLLDLGRRQGRIAMGLGSQVDGAIIRDQSAVKTLGSTMESLVARADLLRTNTVARVVEILNPVQNVRFLSAVTQLQVRVRNLGLQRHA